jgi:hypothetical protein
MEQRVGLASIIGLVVLAAVMIWLHAGTNREKTAPVNAWTDASVTAKIEEALSPYQGLLSEQAAELESMKEQLRQLLGAVEQSDLREDLQKEIEQKAVVTRASLQTDLERYETRLNELNARADDPTVKNEIAATRAEITRIETILDDLSARVDCASMASRVSVRTLVMPSRSSTTIPEETIVMSLGRYKNGRIDTVSVSAQAAPDEPISTRVVGDVPIGGKVEFRHEDHEYIATFTHANGRLFSSALIGIELRAMPLELADCP